MSRTALILAGVFLLPLTAEASRTHHRPWLMHHRETVNEEPKGPPPAYNPHEASALVHQAYKYKGARYKFGGTTKKGIDCSGLVTRVFTDLRLRQVPRTSAALYRYGKPIELAELRPGDLVFFRNTYKHGISHVGIYAGHNRFIHARNKKFGVTVSKISDPYFQIHYAGARRMY